MGIQHNLTTPNPTNGRNENDPERAVLRLMTGKNHCEFHGGLEDLVWPVDLVHRRTPRVVSGETPVPLNSEISRSNSSKIAENALLPLRLCQNTALLSNPNEAHSNLVATPSGPLPVRYASDRTERLDSAECRTA